MNAQLHYFWNRSQQSLEAEQVRGARFLRWSFETKLGRFLLRYLFATRVFSRVLYNRLMDSSLSKRWVSGFIEKNNIIMGDFESCDYANFNDFFIRKFRPGVRPFNMHQQILPAFAEGKYLGYASVSPDQSISVKQMSLNVAEILGNVDKSSRFIDGPILVCRLRPVDYHRFHYPDWGVLLERYRVHGPLHATNPVCYKYKNDVFQTNERQVSILESQNFGLLAYVEVGAMNVGRIVQTHLSEKESQQLGTQQGSAVPFFRGQEKGYFLVGGSTVIVIGQKGKWKPLSELLTQTTRGFETQVKLGEPIAECIQ